MVVGPTHDAQLGGSRDVVLRDGSTVQVRSAMPVDEPGIRDFLERLSGRSRRLPEPL
jgi:hypothetical protein